MLRFCCSRLMLSPTGFCLPIFLTCAAVSSGQSLPVFIPNGGQWDDRVLFQADLGNASLFVERDALTWNLVEWPEALHRHGQSATAKDHEHSRPDHATLIQEGALAVSEVLRGHAYRIQLEGRTGDLQFVGSEPQAGTVNYFLGSDPNRWASGLTRFRKIQASYAPGIDLVLYERGGHIKYDLIVQPGANPGLVQFTYEGPDQLYVREGVLHIETSIGLVRELEPYAYQDIQGERVTIPCRYTLKGNRMHFDFPKGYDERYTLVIDPVTWIFGSYSGATSDNWGYSATYDADGNLFGAGICFGIGYPVTTGAYQTTFGGGAAGSGCDVSITKFSADGTTNLWSTYLGGSGNEFPHSMIANSDGELWVYGSTGSTNFPVLPGAYDEGFSAGTSVTVTGVNFPIGTDIYVSRLSADGSALLASTYVGGVSNDGLNLGSTVSFNYGDHARGEIILDALEQPIVASFTFSADFPVSAGALQSIPGGGQDGVFFQLDEAAENLLWSTYFGGANADGVYSIKVEGTGNMIITGGSTSPDLPTTPGAFSEAYGGGGDGYLARINPDASAVLQCTYIGSSIYDQVYFSALDDDGDVYITGQTRSPSFPISPGVYSVPGSGQFIAKMLPDFSGFVFSSLFGSGSGEINISPTAFLVDVCENMYVSGWGGVTNTFGTTTGLPVTADALKPSTDGSDFYFTVFQAGMAGLEFASFYGGNISREHVDGGTSRFDNQGVIYQAVCAGCGSNDDFPTTTGSVSQTNNSFNCNLGVAKIALDFAGVSASLDVEPDLIGCLPFTANFINNSSTGASYQWDFGDGSPGSSDFEPIHVYSAIGEYLVQLIATDPTSCNGADTAYLTVLVIEDSTQAAFELDILDYCDSLKVSASNTSFTVGSATYFWDFGDGTFSMESDPEHTYFTPGIYTLQLIVSDPLSCNGGDTITQDILVAPRAIAGLTGALGCAPLLVEPLNSSVGISPDYTWDFGDGTTATGESVSHLYTEPGTYTLSLYMSDPLACNNGDTATTTVTVFETPEATINADPESGSFYQIISLSSTTPGGEEYIWDLGNGVLAFGQNISYQYDAPGEYTICLEVITAAECEDTACIVIRLDADSELTFPNAFSPNGDGTNDIFLPFQWGLQGYLLQIYNRWGELVFESIQPGIGWDGTFKGEPQEVGTYKVTAVGRGLDGVEYSFLRDLFLVR